MTTQHKTIKSFSISEVFSKSLNLISKHWQVLVVASLIINAIGLIPNLITYIGGNSFSMAGAAAETIVNISIAIISFFLGYNFLKMNFKAVDSFPLNLSDLFSFNSKNLGNIVMWILTGIVYGLMVFVGLIFLIIPGLYLGARYIFAPYIVVDKKVGIGQALDISSKLTDGHRAKIILYIIISGLISILASLPMVWDIYKNIESNMIENLYTSTITPAFLLTIILGMFISLFLSLATISLYRKLEANLN